MQTLTKTHLAAAASALTLAALPGVGHAATCIGNCGTATGADGDVSAPPKGGTYGWVSTANGKLGAGEISGIGGTNGSEYISDTFTAAAGDMLDFYFNYITADGTSTFPDYGFAELLSGGSNVAYLFTARTVAGAGDTSPGFGLPANSSTLNPAKTPITPGATHWSPLDGSSGFCFGGSGQGCGNTGWIESTYTIKSAGTYSIRFGATNFGDTSVDSGMAFAGIQIAGNPVPIGAPEPGAWMLMITGFGPVGAALRYRRQPVAVSFG
jgi:hypothetical protein